MNLILKFLPAYMNLIYNEIWNNLKCIVIEAGMPVNIKPTFGQSKV